MPPITQHKSTEIVRLIALGHSGTAKTGSLASLAAAGYNVRILDFDNGLDVLKNLVTSQDAKFKPLYFDKGAHERVHYVTLTDPYKRIGNEIKAYQAKAFDKAMNLLTSWKTESEDFGPVESWTPKEILVIDSTTGIGRAAFHHVLGINAKLLSGVQGNEYRRFMGTAQNLCEAMFEMLTSDAIKCNIILNAHINYQDEPGTVRNNENEALPQRGFMSILGRAAGPRVPRLFNNTIQFKKIGELRRIYTSTPDLVDLKNSAPNRVKREYPIETGLADLFKDILGA